jgi:hypothetical protein
MGTFAFLKYSFYATRPKIKRILFSGFVGVPIFVARHRWCGALALCLAKPHTNTDAKGNRIIRVNHKGRNLKQQAHNRLLTEKGIYYRKKRPAEVGTVFGNINSIKTSNDFCSRALKKQR